MASANQALAALFAYFIGFFTVALIVLIWYCLARVEPTVAMGYRAVFCGITLKAVEV